MAELALCTNIILKEALTVRWLSLGWASILKFLLCFWSSMMSESANVASLGAMPTAQPSNTGIRKQWHEDITQDLRNHLVHKLWVANNKQGAGMWSLWGSVRRQGKKRDGDVLAFLLLREDGCAALGLLSWKCSIPYSTHQHTRSIAWGQQQCLNPSKICLLRCVPISWGWCWGAKVQVWRHPNSWHAFSSESKPYFLHLTLQHWRIGVWRIWWHMPGKWKAICMNQQIAGWDAVLCHLVSSP